MRTVFGILTALWLMASTSAFAGAKGGVQKLETVPGVVTTKIGPARDNAFGVVLQPDGKIVVAGASYNGKDADFAVLRYLSNGTLDLTFGDKGVVLIDSKHGDDKAYNVALQKDGKVIVVGSMANGRDSDFAVVRLLADGALDPTFGHKGVLAYDFGHGDDTAYGVAIGPDGRIIVGGSAQSERSLDFALLRVDTAGILDYTFGNWGKAVTGLTTPEGESEDVGYALALQRDGKIVMTGHSKLGENSVLVTLRFLANGGLDPFFEEKGMVITSVGSDKDLAYAVAVQPDGRILVAGASYDSVKSQFLLTRYHRDGRLDRGFGQEGIVTTKVGDGSDIAYGLLLQPNGKILAIGATTSGTDADFAVVRYHTDGRIDSSFGSRGKVTTRLGSRYDVAYAAALQPDGRIVVAGVREENGSYDVAITRYADNGAIDKGFGNQAPSSQYATTQRSTIAAEMGFGALNALIPIFKAPRP